MDWVRLAIELVLGLSAGGALLGLLMLRQQKRKLLSEAGKTDTEADVLFSDAYARLASAKILLLEPYEKVMTRMQQELDEANERIDLLEQYVGVLIETMRESGIQIPSRPRPTPPTPPPPAGRRNRS
jgi:hypothetical protein